MLISYFPFNSGTLEKEGKEKDAKEVMLEVIWPFAGMMNAVWPAG